MRSLNTVADCANAESRARHAATTSRAVTGAPSQKRASSRNVKVQRSPAASHDWASPGSTRPAQSRRISVSYSAAKTNRSASLRGEGACVGSMGSASATATVSRFDAGPGAMRHAVSEGAAPGAGSSGAAGAGRPGGPARQATVSSTASRSGRRAEIIGGLWFRGSFRTIPRPGSQSQRAARSAVSGPSGRARCLPCRGSRRARARSPARGAPDGAR